MQRVQFSCNLQQNCDERYLERDLKSPYFPKSTRTCLLPKNSDLVKLQMVRLINTNVNPKIKFTILKMKWKESNIKTHQRKKT